MKDHLLFSLCGSSPYDLDHGKGQPGDENGRIKGPEDNGRASCFTHCVFSALMF